MRASAAASIRPRVAGVSGQWMLTKSERSSSSSSATPPEREVCRSSQPKPATRSPTARPMRP